VANEQISAQVVLRPADGRELTGHEVITSETVERYRPSPEAVSQVAEFLRAAGFQVSEEVGISFSITGPRPLFERLFGMGLEHRRRSGIDTVQTPAGGLELPLDRLPPDVARFVQAVTFTPPPDFGPGNP
jgi:hypothetical protein